MFEISFKFENGDNVFVGEKKIENEWKKKPVESRELHRI